MQIPLNSKSITKSSSNDTSLQPFPASQFSHAGSSMLCMDVLTSIPDAFFISESELEVKIRQNQNIIDLSKPIVDPFAANFEDNTHLSLFDSDGCILFSLNDGHIGAICPGFMLINNNTSVKDSLLKGMAVNLYSAEANENLICMPIITNESFICLGISNTKGKISNRSLNMAFYIYKLLSNQYRLTTECTQLADELLEFNSNAAFIVDENGYITTANTNCLNFFNISSKDLLKGLPVNHLLNNYGQLLDFRNIQEDSTSSFEIFCQNEWQPVELVGRRLLEIPIGCRQIAISFRRPACYPYRIFSMMNNSSYQDDPFIKIIGTNPAIKKNIEIAKKAAKIPTTVLIEGESGTGKELIAQGIHKTSHRKGPFVAINCGGMSRELLQSELFGYAEGAFTGAKKGGKIGKLQEADGGTVFLDEIGEMPEDMQITLLRFLQDRLVIPVGGNHPHQVDVRVIAATNRNLRNEVQSGAFREDLFYRLNVINIKMPPLRERREDIPLLAEYMIKAICSGYQIPIKALSKKCMPQLMQYNWPGNVRELHNVIERAIVFADDNMIIDDLFLDELPSEEKLVDVEKTTIINLLDRNHGNISATAKALGIARTTLYRKMKGLEIGETLAAK